MSQHRDVARMAGLLALLLVALCTVPAFGQLVNPASLSFNAVSNGSFQSGTLTLQPGTNTFFSIVPTVTGTATNWLSVSLASGTTTPTAVITVFANPTNLAPGSYQGNLAVTYTNPAQTVNVPVVFNITASGSGTVSPTTLTLSSAAGATVPVQTNLTISSPQSSQFTVQASSSQGWLSVFPPSGAASPAGTVIAVYANPNVVSSGTYQGQLTITLSNPSQVITVPVTYNAGGTGGGTGGVSLTPSSIGFTVPTGTSTLQQQFVTLNTTNASSFFASVTSGSWLSVAPNSGVTGPTSILTISANPFGLAAGVYQGQISVTAGNPSQTLLLPVTLDIGGTGGGTGVVSPTTFNFAVAVGTTTPQQQAYSINIGTGSSPFSVTGTTTSGGNWLQASPSGGTANPTFTGGFVTINPAGLPAGTYTGNLRFSFSATSQNIDVPVTLTVGSGGGTGGVTVTPNPVNLSGAFGTTTAATTVVTVTANNGSTVTVTPQGATWLSVTPTSTTALPSAFFSITANPSGLNIGTYSGSLLIATSNPAQTITVPVNFTVSTGGGTGSLSVFPTSASFSASVGGSTQFQTLTLTTPANTTFSASSSASWLSVSPTSGTSSGSTSLFLSANPSGLTAQTYSATVSIQTTVGTLQVPVTFAVGGGGTGVVSVSPNSLNFSAPVGGTSQSQAFTLFTPANTTFSIGSSPATNWLSVSQPSGTSNGSTTITATVNPAVLTAGTYTTTMIITTSAGVVNVPVNFVVGGGGSGTPVSPTSLTLTSPAGSSATQSANITITGSGTFYQIFPSTNWLSVNPTSGSLNGSVTVSVTANPSGLTTGTYTGNLQINIGTQQQSINVPVTFSVGGGGTGALTITAPLNGSGSTTLTVTPTQSGTVSVQVASSTCGTCISISPATASASAGVPTSFTLTGNASGLSAGTYTATINVYQNNLLFGFNNVTFNVGGAGSGPISPTSLTFNTPVGVQPAVQTFSINTTQASSFQVQVQSTCNCIVVAPSSGVTAGSGSAFTAQVQVGVNSISLPAGTYTGTVSVFVNNLSVGTVNVTVNVGTSAGSIVNPSQLTFNYQTGTTLPTPQLVTINPTGGTSTSFTATATTTTGGTWLTVTPTAGTAPGFVVISINPAALQPGNYAGNIAVTLQGSTTPVNIPVSLNVSSTALLRLSQSSVTFNSQQGVSGQLTQTVDVTSTGATALPYTVGTSVTSPSGGSWLSVAQTSGTTPGQVTIAANASGLSAGTYNGTVTFSSPNISPITLPVTLVVSVAPLLNASPQQVNFTYTLGSQFPAAQALQISSTSGSIFFTQQAQTISGGGWLTVTPQSGSTPTSLQVQVSPSGLVEGVYYGTVVVTAQQGSAANSPMIVPVVLTVTSATSNLVVSPNQPLTFTALTGGGTPPAQTLSISSSGTLLSYSVTPTTLTGGNWLSVTPASGLTPGSVSVSVNAASLAQGTYSGSVIVTAQGAPNSPQVIPVNLIVGTPPTITVSPTSVTLSASTTGVQTNSTTVQLASSGSNLNFTTQATTSSGGNWLSVTPASGTTPATLTVTANTTGMQAGTYNGTVTVNLGLASPITIPVTLTVGTQQPSVITAVTNAASFLPTAVAPGMMVAIFGTNLGPAQLTQLQLTPQGTVATTLAGVRVLFDGIPAPLIYVRQDVIAAVVPYEVDGRASVKVGVEYQGIRGREIDALVINSRPGIFTLNQQGTGQGAIQNSDFSVNGPTNPVARGSYVIVYYTGEGQTTPTGITGQIAQASLLRRPAGSVQVRVGGIAAEVISATSVPTTILGFAQVVFFIPQNAQVGAAVPVELIIGGNSSQPGVTLAIR